MSSQDKVLFPMTVPSIRRPQDSIPLVPFDTQEPLVLLPFVLPPLSIVSGVKMEIKEFLATPFPFLHGTTLELVKEDPRKIIYWEAETLPPFWMTE